MAKATLLASNYGLRNSVPSATVYTARRRAVFIVKLARAPT